MPPELLQILTQIPIVVAFIWYSDRKDKQFQATLDKRDEAYEKRNAAVIAHLESMNERVCTELSALRRTQEEHDRYVRSGTKRIVPKTDE